MIDKNLLILELLDECKRDIFKEIPTWIFSVINRQPEIENERDKPKKPKHNKELDIYGCPNCDVGDMIWGSFKRTNCCPKCGQRIDWSD